ncbi:TVP38/TMEM64 family protein [Candidatus Woesearchaeota archaeon]|nr:TVP38/TMEM64 family protein [Candidatus Woesearchaeota archaeon]
MKQKHRFFGYAVVVVIALIIAALAMYFPAWKQFSSPTFLRDYLLHLGNWGYFAYIILFVLSIPLPIPSTPVALVGGYLYGTVVGTILTLIATVIGASISFYLVRKFGQPLLERFVSKHHIIHFNHIFKKRGVNAALISYAIPIFPSDALNFLLGLTKMRWHTFLLVVLVGYIPRYIIINALGENLQTGFSVQTILWLVLSAVLLGIAVFREQIKRLIFKELRELEKEAEVVEKEIRL